MNIVTLPKRLRIVVLNAPFEHWERPGVADLFSEVVSLKLEGYGREYEEGVLSVDHCDFIGTHLLICEETQGKLRAITGYKSVRKSVCDAFHTPFTPYSICSSSNVPERRLDAIIRDAEARGIDLTYDNSWTMREAYRADRAFAKEIRNVVTTIGVYYHLDYGIPEWLVMGIKRFKTNEYFEWMGASTFTDEFQYYSSKSEPAVLLNLQKYSEQALQIADQYRELWDNRIELGTIKRGELGRAA